MINEQSLLGALNTQIICMKCISECCKGRLNDEQTPYVQNFPSINGNNQEHHSALMSGKIIFLLFLLLVELKYLHKKC